MDKALIADLCVILGYINLKLPSGRIINKLKSITTDGYELLGDAETIEFKDVQSTYMRIVDDTVEWSFIGILGNDTIGWLKASTVPDDRVYSIHLWVSTKYPPWYPDSKTMS